MQLALKQLENDTALRQTAKINDLFFTIIRIQRIAWFLGTGSQQQHQETIVLQHRSQAAEVQCRALSSLSAIQGKAFAKTA